MIIKKVKIQNFRCFEEKSIRFDPVFTIITGKNAIGKSSVLEAINFLGICKSFRTIDYKELINENSNYFFVEGVVSSEDRVDKISVFCCDGLKTAKINNCKIDKLSEYVGFFNIVTFSALDFLALKMNSAERRKMFDLVFCQISKDYMISSNYYKKFLKERNALLKSLIIENSKGLEVLLDTISEQLVYYGNKIIEYRKSICEKISNYANLIHGKITEGKEILVLEYKQSTNSDFGQKLKNSKSEDLRKGYTTVGPHRDDFIFNINGKNVMTYGSQGQQKNCILSVKLAMAELINEIKKEAPTLLLDDVFSELDKKRQNAIIENLNPNFQTIMTTASVSDIDESILKSSLIINLE